ncbi:MAG: antibiotic biosynthesis monooxygenase [Oscillospiraceae bacterium]|nr:antibiotic biosynthesis monooxygenase [Oscillospiraceae bacterium]
MIVLNVTYKCLPGKNKALVERIRAEGIDVACRADEGNIKYDYYLPTDGSEELLLIEKWQDARTLQAHGAQPHLKRLMAFKPEYATETIVERFEV